MNGDGMVKNSENDKKYMYDGRRVWMDLIMMALSKEEIKFTSFVTKHKKIAEQMVSETHGVLEASKNKLLFPLVVDVVSYPDGDRLHNRFAIIHPVDASFVVKFCEFIHKSESFGHGIESFNIFSEKIFPTIVEARAEIKRMQALAQV